MRCQFRKALDQSGYKRDGPQLIHADTKFTRGGCGIKALQAANFYLHDAQHTLCRLCQALGERRCSHAVTDTHKQRVTKAFAHALKLVA